MLTEAMDHYGLARDLRAVGYFETEHHRQIVGQVRTAILAGRLIAVTGIAGSGKTVLLRRLQHDLAREGKVRVCKSLSVDKERATLPTLIAARLTARAVSPERSRARRRSDTSRRGPDGTSARRPESPVEDASPPGETRAADPAGPGRVEREAYGSKPIIPVPTQTPRQSLTGHLPVFTPINRVRPPQLGMARAAPDPFRYSARFKSPSARQLVEPVAHGFEFLAQRRDAFLHGLEQAGVLHGLDLLATVGALEAQVHRLAELEADAAVLTEVELVVPLVVPTSLQGPEQPVEFAL